MEYKKLIKELIDEIQDQKFLRKIYTIIIRHIRRGGS